MGEGGLAHGGVALAEEVADSLSYGVVLQEGAARGRSPGEPVVYHA